MGSNPVATSAGSNVKRWSPVWRNLRGTTVLAADDNGPHLFVVPDSRYCYWDADVGKVTVEVLLNTDAQQKLTIRLVHGSPNGPQPLVLNCSDFAADSHLMRFLRGVADGKSITVAFEADSKERDIRRVCKIGFISRLRLRRFLKTIRPSVI